MVQVWGCDDMLSLRNFLCNFVTFCSSQGKEIKRVTIFQKHDTIPQGRMHCFDIKENVSRWLKRDMIW